MAPLLGFGGIRNITMVKDDSNFRVIQRRGWCGESGQVEDEVSQSLICFLDDGQHFSTNIARSFNVLN